MVQDLEQLLARPLGAALRAKVVEDEQRRCLHRFEQLVIRDVAAGRERRAQMIEQVGDDRKENLTAEFDASIGDRRGQVRLATPGWPAEQQPRRRIVGVFAAPLQGLSEGTLVLGAERAAAQGKEVL